MDIIRERLEREYDLDLVVTNPSTDYHVNLVNGETLDIKSASELPEMTKVRDIAETLDQRRNCRAAELCRRCYSADHFQTRSPE